MKASYVVWLGVNLREELLRIWTFCFTRFCSVLRRKISFTDCVDEDSWDEDNSHSFAHAISCFRALHHRWHFASSSSGIWTLFMKSSLEGPESEEHEKKKKNTNKNTTMTRAPANFFRKCEKFAKDKVIYGKEGLEYWNTAKERRNLRSFDMKTSPHRDAIFFLRVSWIVLPKWARVAYFPRKDSLKLNRSVKTPWHRSSMGVERSK